MLRTLFTLTLSCSLALAAATPSVLGQVQGEWVFDESLFFDMLLEDSGSASFVRDYKELAELGKMEGAPVMGNLAIQDGTITLNGMKFPSQYVLTSHEEVDGVVKGTATHTNDLNRPQQTREVSLTLQVVKGGLVMAETSSEVTIRYPFRRP